MAFHSRYKIFSLLFLIFMIFLLGALCYLFIFLLITKSDSIKDLPIGVIILISLFIFSETWLLFIFMTDCRRIKVDKEKIIFINPILPFIKKSISWSNLDYCMTVYERSRYATYYTLWLVKDRRLKARISGFYIANYTELQNAIKIPYKGETHINLFKQIACRLQRGKVPLFHDIYL